MDLLYSTTLPMRPPPNDVVWELTLACNLRCRHCGSSAGCARPDELDTDEALDVVEQLADLGCARVTLMGGELFLRPDWAEIVTALVRRGRTVELISNGLLIDEELARKLAELGVTSVSLSIDGPLVEHDQLRGRGSYDGAMRALRALHAAGLPVGVVTSVHTENLHALDALHDALVETDVCGWQLQLCQPLGRAESAHLLLAPEQLPELEAFLLRVLERGQLWTYAADNIGYMSPAEPLIRTGLRQADRCWMGCGAGVQVLGITSSGSVRGCMSLPDAFDEGNLRQRSLQAIWNDPASFGFNRDPAQREPGGHCTACALFRVCRGGCSSLAFATTGRVGSMAHCLRRVADGAQP